MATVIYFTIGLILWIPISWILLTIVNRSDHGYGVPGKSTPGDKGLATILGLCLALTWILVVPSSELSSLSCTGKDGTCVVIRLQNISIVPTVRILRGTDNAV